VTLQEAFRACEACGDCRSACEVLSREGLSIGEIAGRVSAGPTFDAMKRAVTRCAVCGQCCSACPASIDSAEVMTAVREVLVAVGELSFMDPETFFSGHDLSLLAEYKRCYGISYDDLRPDKCDAVLFAGCSLAAYAPGIVRAAHEWLQEREGVVAVADSCCGAPLSLAGLPDQAAEFRSHAAAEVLSRGAGMLIVACPYCLHQLRGQPGGVEVVLLSSLLREGGVTVAGPELLTVHDSCGDRGTLTAATDVRALLSGSQVAEMAHSREATMCCGSGGLVSAMHSDLGEARARTRMNEYRATGAAHLVTSCGHCSHRLDSVAAEHEVLHYLELVFGMRVDWADVNAKLAALS